MSDKAPATARRILVCDDQPLFRRGLATLIDKEPDLALCADASGFQEAIDMIATTHPDLVVSELPHVGPDAIGQFKRMKSRCGTTPVLILTSHDTMRHRKLALAMGASAVVGKAQPVVFLLQTIRQVLARTRHPGT